MRNVVHELGRIAALSEVLSLSGDLVNACNHQVRPVRHSTWYPGTASAATTPATTTRAIPSAVDCAAAVRSNETGDVAGAPDFFTVDDSCISKRDSKADLQFSVRSGTVYNKGNEVRVYVVVGCDRRVAYLAGKASGEGEKK
jgi:hypothetical protein